MTHAKQLVPALVVAASWLSVAATMSPAQVTIRVLPQAVDVKVDATVDVDIVLDTGGNAVGGGAVFLAFDSEVLEFTGGTVDTAVWNLSFVTTQPRVAGDSVVSFAVGAATEIESSDVALASLTFRAKAPGSAALALLFNPGAENTVFTAADLVTEFTTVGVDATLVVAGPTATPTASPPPSPTRTPTTVVSDCVGDCSTDGSVTVDEVLLMVGVALGSSDASACPRGDTNVDGDITVDEILTAVQNALTGCPAI